MGIVAVNLNAIHFPEWHIPFNLASGIVAADVGKAVALDTSVANTVKLAGDGDAVFGRLEIVENRVQEGMLIGTVALKFIAKLPKSGTVNVGDHLQGAGSGAVKALTVSQDTAAGSGSTTINKAKHDVSLQVVEVGSDYVIAIKQ